MQSIDMNQIVGKYHILFVCLDSLRYDVAYEEQQNQGTPVLNRYGGWRKCQAPGNFTYPSHQAMFAGFFPVDEGVLEMKNREKLFFSEDIGMGRKAPEGAFTFRGSNWIEGLEKEGYETICIGGVSFFDKRTDIGKVMPSYFKQSYWNPSFGCRVKDSPRNQVDFAVRKIGQMPEGQKIMMYLNFSALHYPNYFYVQGEKKDSKQAHAAALRYVDEQLKRLFAAFCEKGKTFVICCSDHGTCYGEDGVWYHGVNHPIVNTVPYKHFIL
ncbi:MAG: STM4013/SEN3800 family hydrolase [Lachnospiraceae bacterium]|nr:STM4013/SEN3800 family hydrolase [Lachnospiraceae bacterium]